MTVEYAWMDACGMGSLRVFRVGSEKEAREAEAVHWRSIPPSKKEEYIRLYKEDDAVHRAVCIVRKEDGSVSYNVLRDSLEEAYKDDVYRRFSEELTRSMAEGYAVELMPQSRGFLLFGGGVTAYTMLFEEYCSPLIESDDGAWYSPREFLAYATLCPEYISGGLCDA